ncbi:hypothetical protein [Actinoplanes sp. URMC 104]|uniref:hypothetical protein n=1 Tax=Actinoplanes sp. URMC 104 TaxID=3423409 RepID=UPI003F1E1A9C
MRDVDARTKVAMVLAVTNEWITQLEQQLAAAGWRTQRRDPGELPKVTPAVLMGAVKGAGSVSVLLRGDLAVVAVVIRRRPLSEHQAPGDGHEPGCQCGEVDWRAMFTGTAPPNVVAAVAALAAHDPDDLGV